MNVDDGEAGGDDGGSVDGSSDGSSDGFPDGDCGGDSGGPVDGCSGEVTTAEMVGVVAVETPPPIVWNQAYQAISATITVPPAARPTMSPVFLRGGGPCGRPSSSVAVPSGGPPPGVVWCP